jgi:hypothetical protein
MGRVLSIAASAFAVALLAGASPARALDWDFSLDVRAADSDGRRSFLDDGLGKLVPDGEASAMQLGRVRGALHQPLGEVFALNLDASYWGGEDADLLGLTEAYVEYRPYPRSALRTRVRAGAFYPPTSVENRAAGWETPYTLSSSALNTWIAEEIRAVGIEGEVEWVGTRVGHSFDVSLVASVFGWNDPAGVLIAAHGFALNDHQTPLFGRVGQRGAAVMPGREVFHELDGRPGYYVAGKLRYFDRATLSLLHYDNRADPTVYSASLDDFAWETRYDTAGLRVESERGWTGIVEWLGGYTIIEPGGPQIVWDFESWSALLSRKLGPHSLSVRRDEFYVDHWPAADPGTEDGDAWTLAYSYERGERWRVLLEWLSVSSTVSARPVLLGEPAYAREEKLELSVRYSVRGAAAARSQ